ncbi:MAG TPA: MerR family transcriptional regulator [Candidatus Saccharimonadales bacterium]|nr:MerR family transcriptional regulator [Candidatus Saccharimonadales bacterium]
MKVSDLAQQAGIAPSAVRFYERRGVLPAASRRDNGYREYSENDLCRLRMVVSFRRLGLDPVEAGRLASLCMSGQCDAMTQDLAVLVADQRRMIARQRAELDELDRQLAVVETSLGAGGETQFVRAKEVPMSHACCGPECPCPCPPEGPCC